MSGHLRADDVRQLLRLVGECREIENGAEGRWSHFLDGIARITRSQVAIHFNVRTAPGAPIVVDEVHDVGWPAASDRDQLYAYYQTNAIEVDPLSTAALAQARPMATLKRSDAVGSSAWARTELLNDVYRPLRLRDSLVSLAHRARRGAVRAIVLKRAIGEPLFGEAERELVDVAHGDCGELLDGPAASSRALDAEWSPRERATLELLLTGASEKSIAATLGLSPHTVHDYVKVIYKHLGVASRAELMARALGKPLAVRSEPVAARGELRVSSTLIATRSVTGARSRARHARAARRRT